MTTFQLTIAILISAFSFAAAQDGQFDVRFNVADYNCTTQNLLVDIQVQATNGNAFNISDQNYRFSFNRDAVTAVNIEATDNALAGIVTDANGKTSFYNNPTLTGSVDTVVSYNVSLAGGEGFFVASNWVTVGRINIQVANNNACINLVWHDQAPVNFPPTFIGEKAGTSLTEAAEGTYTNLNVCVAELCNAAAPAPVANGSTSVYPNPVQSGTAVNVRYFNPTTTQAATIIITDVSGRIVATQNVELEAGYTTTSIDTNNFAAGTYFASVQTNNAGVAQQFVVVGK